MKISKISEFEISSFIFILLFLNLEIAPQSLAAINLPCINLYQDKSHPHPSQFIYDFPVLNWNMNFEDAMNTIRKAGLNPVSIVKTEIAWDGKFGDVFGRATILLDEKTDIVNQMSVVLYGMNKLDQLFNDWKDKLTKKYGNSNSKEDNSNAVSIVWKLKEKILIELRKLKDPDSPVININWVKK